MEFNKSIPTLFEAGRRSQGQAFGALVEMAKAMATDDVLLEETLADHELTYFNGMHSSFTEAYKEGGIPKYNAYWLSGGMESVAIDFGLDYRKVGSRLHVNGLPPSYRTAKSVVLRAIAEGLDIGDKGKTALEKEIAAKKEPADPNVTAMRYADLIARAWDGLNYTTRDAIQHKIGAL